MHCAVRVEAPGQQQPKQRQQLVLPCAPAPGTPSQLMQNTGSHLTPAHTEHPAHTKHQLTQNTSSHNTHPNTQLIPNTQLTQNTSSYKTHSRLVCGSLGGRGGHRAWSGRGSPTAGRLRTTPGCSRFSRLVIDETVGHFADTPSSSITVDTPTEGSRGGAAEWQSRRRLLAPSLVPGSNCGCSSSTRTHAS